MRTVTKDVKSKILTNRLKYVSGNSTNNLKIALALLEEQRGYCAYTDEYISRTDAKDIEHFNPTLKDTPNDDYSNWFLVKHQWNMEKSEKWKDFQPVLHPTATDLEERIIYVGGDYVAHSTDVDANNLIKLLKLDDPILADKRKRYIKRKKQEMSAYGQDAAIFFNTLLNEDACQVHYLRAIREEFRIDIWTLLK